MPTNIEIVRSTPFLQFVGSKHWVAHKVAKIQLVDVFLRRYFGPGESTIDEEIDSVIHWAGTNTYYVLIKAKYNGLTIYPWSLQAVYGLDFFNPAMNSQWHFDKAGITVCPVPVPIDTDNELAEIAVVRTRAFNDYLAAIPNLPAPSNQSYPFQFTSSPTAYLKKWDISHTSLGEWVQEKAQYIYYHQNCYYIFVQSEVMKSGHATLQCPWQRGNFIGGFYDANVGMINTGFFINDCEEMSLPETGPAPPIPPSPE